MCAAVSPQKPITVKDIAAAIESHAPLCLQESYDNAGLQIGNPASTVTGVLLCLDVTEPIVEEAIGLGYNMIVSHHPLIFKGIKHITGSTATERIIASAIKNEIAIYSAHTNMDNAWNGVSHEIAHRLGLDSIKVLSPTKGLMLKLVVFTPISYAAAVRSAAFTAGAGQLGNYDACSFTVEGKGTFRALEGSHPYTGEQDILHTEPEVRQEFLISPQSRKAVLAAVIEAHPYEEPAIDIIALDNESKYYGCGVIGEISPVKASVLLEKAKSELGVETIRYRGDANAEVSRVAICGGAGAFLIPVASAAGAQIYITGDVKYHDFASCNPDMILADIGHFESEQHTKSIFYRIISEKFPNFAINFSKIEKNPINYI